MVKNQDQGDLQDDEIYREGDDFYDDQEGVPSEEENWEEGEDSAPSETQESEKKKTSFSTIAIIAGGVICALIILYVQFGGNRGASVPEGMAANPVVATGNGDVPPSSSPVSPVLEEPARSQAGQKGGEAVSGSSLSVVEQTAPKAKASDQSSGGSLEALRAPNGGVGVETVDPSLKEATLAKNPAEDRAKGGFMNDPSLMPTEVEGKAAPVAMEPVDPDTTAPSQKPPVVENPVTPVSDFPTVDAIKKPNSMEKKELSPEPVKEAEPPKVVQVPVSSSEVAPSPDSVKELKTQLEAALKRIEDLEKKAAQQPAPAPVSSSPEEISALKDAMDQLQGKVESLSAEKASWGKAQKEAVASLPASEPKAAALHPERATPSGSKAVSFPRKVPESGPKKSVVWDLKGAVPGQAMISLRGERDLKTVCVGDKVSGIGRVVSIENTGRGWVVRGTTGQIRQE